MVLLFRNGKDKRRYSIAYWPPFAFGHDNDGGYAIIEY